VNYAVCALFPIICGAIMQRLPLKSRRWRAFYVMGVSLITSAWVFGLIFSGAGNTFEIFRITDRFVCALRMDKAGSVFLGLAAALWPFAVLYATEYMRHEERENSFFGFYTICYGVVILLAASANIFTLYVFYELLTLATIPLVFHKKDKESIRATRKYVLYLFGGASLGLAALVVLSCAPTLSQTGVEAFAPGGVAFDLDKTLLCWMAIFAFVGFGAKAAVFPVCFWLPAASAAPTPVTALLHAVAVVNAGVFSVIRVFYYVLPTEAIHGTFAQSACLALCAFTVVYACVMAVREQHFKRRFAWSTVSNLSYMLFGAMLLSADGMGAAMVHMVFHSFMKIVLFFCAGAVMVCTGRTQVRQLHGMAKAMPYTFACCLLAGAALCAVPPMAGFISKYCLLTAAFADAGAWQIVGAVSLIISSVLTMVYVFSAVLPAFFMPLNREILPLPAEKCDPGMAMKISMGVLCVCIVALSVFAGDIIRALYAVAGA